MVFELFRQVLVNISWCQCSQAWQLHKDLFPACQTCIADLNARQRTQSPSPQLFCSHRTSHPLQNTQDLYSWSEGFGHGTPAPFVEQIFSSMIEVIGGHHVLGLRFSFYHQKFPYFDPSMAHMYLRLLHTHYRSFITFTARALHIVAYSLKTSCCLVMAS